jgi:hypothetical protein
VDSVPSIYTTRYVLLTLQSSITDRVTNYIGSDISKRCSWYFVSMLSSGLNL